MRIAVAVFAAALLLTGCKKVVGPANPETPAAAEAPAAAPAADMAADTAATGDAAAQPAPGGDRSREEGTGDRGNRGNDDREGDVTPAAPNR